MHTFQLHSQLQQDCFLLGKLELCQVLLVNDNQFPWFILVPQRTGIREIYQLDVKDQITLIQESSYLAENLTAIFSADKMNIAAIGNLVEQLHLHHVVRYKNDKAWATPIWGLLPAVPYTKQQYEEIVARLDTLQLLH